MAGPSLRDRARAARAEGWALAAFNAVNLETAQAAVMAAEAERAPVILQISENAARYGGIETLAAMARAVRADATVPVYLHFDHAESLASAERAVALGFDGVMLETAHLTPEKGAQRLRELVELARPRGIAVEGEAEIVAKGTRRGIELGSEAELAALVETSGCDLLAIDIGSRHKQLDKRSRLDLERLRRVAGVHDIPFVLHGASGVVDEELRQASKLGVAKINVATDLMRTFTDAVRHELTDPDLHDPRRYLGAGREAMAGRARELLRLFGSSGRATRPPASADAGA